MRYRTTIEIDRPVAEVFRVVATDFADSYPKYCISKRPHRCARAGTECGTAAPLWPPEVYASDWLSELEVGRHDEAGDHQAGGNKQAEDYCANRQ